ncbi:MAG: nucleoside monophosphate kinase [Patescibacteria group bacterium]
MHKKIYSFLGLPASGKGTQVEFLAKERDLRVVSLGDLIREKIEEGNKTDRFFAEIKSRYDSGVPQRDEVVADLVKQQLRRADRGLIFDNFPFSLRQAALLDKFVEEFGWSEPLLIYLEISPETAVRRVIHRKVCSECGHIYISDTGNTCEVCGGALISRADDKEDVVRKRVDFYLPRIREVFNQYNRRGQAIEIDGEPAVAEVNRSLMAALEKFEQHHRKE